MVMSLASSGAPPMATPGEQSNERIQAKVPVVLLNASMEVLKRRAPDDKTSTSGKRSKLVCAALSEFVANAQTSSTQHQNFLTYQQKQDAVAVHTGNTVAESTRLRVRDRKLKMDAIKAACTPTPSEANHTEHEAVSQKVRGSSGSR